MINRIRIKGFQSHIDSCLDLDPGVNYIVGPSNSGKSAIIRALRWVWLNRPLGSAHVSRFSPECLVAVEGEDWEVVRVQQDRVNAYRINGKLYQSFGQNPPEEVEQVLNLDPVNLQTQRDSLFLLGESPGKVAAYLNSLVGLDVVDRILKEVGSRIRTITAREKVYQDRLEELQRQLSEIPAALDEADRVLDQALATQEFLAQADRYLDWIYEQADALMDARELLLFTEEQISRIDYHRMVALKKNLEILYNKIRYLEEQRQQLQGIKESLEQTVPDLDCEGPYRRLQETKSRLERLGGYREECQRIKTQLQLAEGRIASLDQELADKMPPECPLCGQPIPTR